MHTDAFKTKTKKEEVDKISFPLTTTYKHYFCVGNNIYWC